MIIKKPYAFLIKYFKIIHLGLFISIALVTYNFNKIVNFFSQYVKDNISVFEGIAKNYIYFYHFLIIILIIIFAMFMYLLMKKKQKPKLFYILIFAYYLLILILSVTAYNQINILTESSLTKQSARAYADIYLILSFPNYYFLIISLIRSIGFDIKKFNFKKDLEELEIHSDDDEEFEFVFGSETYRYKRKIRRAIRELKYYFFENKFLITIISAIGFIIIAILLIYNTQILNKVYTKGKALAIENIGIVLNNAYISEKDYNGSTIKKNQKYVIADVTVKNNGLSSSIAREKIFLTYSNKTIHYSTVYKNSFLDFGKGYDGGTIISGKTDRFLLIFEIPTNLKTNNFKLNLLKNKTYDKDNKLVFNYNKYKLKPKKIDKEINLETKQINEIMYLGEKYFNDSSLLIKNVEIKNSYEYTYESCSQNKCDTLYNVETVSNALTQKLLIVTYNLSLNKNILINNSMTALQKDKFIIDSFFKIKYLANNETTVINVNSRLNSQVKDKIFIDIPIKASQADKLEILFKTRENHYNIKIS